MLSLRATTLAAIAFMKNYSINGKRIADLTCPLCGTKMLPQEMEYSAGPQCYERGRLHPVSNRLSNLGYRGHCPGCNGEVRISNASLDVLNLVAHATEHPSLHTISAEFFYMGITSVRYGRIKSLPNYENERMEVEVELKDGQTPEQGLIEAKKFVKNQLGLGPSDKDVKAARQLLIEAGEIPA